MKIKLLKTRNFRIKIKYWKRMEIEGAIKIKDRYR